MEKPYLILLADNHLLFRREIKRILKEISGLTVVGEVENGPALFQFLLGFTPHLLILDISLPNLKVIEAISRIRQTNPEVKVLIMIWDKEAEYLLQPIGAGASGCLLKEDVEMELPLAISRIRQGRIYLPANLPTLFHEKALLHLYSL